MSASGWEQIGDAFQNLKNESNKWRGWLVILIIIFVLSIILFLTVICLYKTPNYKNDFKTITHLGAGSFGTVCKAEKISDGQLYAVKRVEALPNTNSESIMREAEILSKLKHPNIVRCHNYWFEKDGTKKYLYIQMELCPYDLEKWLKWESSNQDDFPMLNLEIVKQQLTNGVEYIHSKNIIHRDLKPLNVLLTQSNYTIKICDFGLATMNKDYNGNCTSVFENRVHTTKVGTPLYMAPELWNGKIYDGKVDIYSLGMIFLMLLSIHALSYEEIIKTLCLKNFTLRSDFVKKHIAEYGLIKTMLDVNPTKRPTASKIKEMLM